MIQYPYLWLDIRDDAAVTSHTPSSRRLWTPPEMFPSTSRTTLSTTPARPRSLMAPLPVPGGGGGKKSNIIVKCLGGGGKPKKFWLRRLGGGRSQEKLQEGEVKKNCKRERSRISGGRGVSNLAIPFSGGITRALNRHWKYRYLSAILETYYLCNARSRPQSHITSGVHRFRFLRPHYSRTHGSLSPHVYAPREPL